MPTRCTLLPRMREREKQRQVLSQRSLSATLAAPSQTHYTYIYIYDIYIICICIAAARKNLISFLFHSLSLSLCAIYITWIVFLLSSRGDVFALCDKLSWQQSRNFYMPSQGVRTFLAGTQRVGDRLYIAKVFYWSAQQKESIGLT